MDLSQIKNGSVICLGNICRSPISKVVLRDRFEKHNLDIEVCSGGIGNWHVSQGANKGTMQVLEENDYLIRHSARQIKPKWFASHDLSLAMDSTNYRDIQEIGGHQHESKIKMFREFDSYLKILLDLKQELDVPDPYDENVENF